MSSPRLIDKKKSASRLAAKQDQPAANLSEHKVPAERVDYKRWPGEIYSRFKKFAGLTILVAILVTAFAVALGAVKLPWTSGKGGASAPPAKDATGVELVEGMPNSLRVPDDTQRSLGILRGKDAQIAVAERPSRKAPLEMPGSTALDPSHLIRVRVRFAPADVVQIGQIKDPHGSPGNIPLLTRDLQVGDPVKRGDLLAVLFSIDVGNKKNDLFDALSQLRLDENVLKRAEDHADAVPEVFLLKTRRIVEADENAVNRAENTLKTWNIPEEDIQAIRDEARHATDTQQKRAAEKEKLVQWARVELRAPDDGFIIEQNAALHETIVDNTTNLFQIAKIDPLVVLASVPEDELPALHDLKTRTQDHVRWTVRTVGIKPIEGFVDDISYLIDPNQHTAVVRGHIPNRDGLLRAGQFITATVELLPPQDVVEVPISAIVEDGNESVVFVQPDAKQPVFTMRRVEVTNRFDHTAYVRSTPLNKGEKVNGKQTGKEALREGDRVLTAGVLELKTVLAVKQSEK